MLFGLLLFFVGFIKLQTWFPSVKLWQDFIMSETLSIPEYDNWWDFMKYNVSFAVISGLGVASAGFGIWLMATSVFECKDCGHKDWEQDNRSQIK